MMELVVTLQPSMSLPIFELIKSCSLDSTENPT